MAGGWIASAALAVLLTPVAVSPTVRTTYFRQLAIERARFIRPTFVMLGDSLTEKGQPWSLRLGLDPLAAISLARGGATIYQIAGSTDEVRKYHPRYIHILGGSNDLLLGDRDEKAFVRRYSKMLDQLPKDATILVTMIPPTKYAEESARTRLFNAALLPVLRMRGVHIIDPWPQMTRGGIIDPAYTTDGVHLSEAAYKLWEAAITRAAH